MAPHKSEWTVPFNKRKARYFVRTKETTVQSNKFDISAAVKTRVCVLNQRKSRKTSGVCFKSYRVIHLMQPYTRAWPKCKK